MEDQVQEAHARLMAAFGEGRLEDYFGCFADDATFVFHGERWLGSLEEYRTEWGRWVTQDGFAVRSAESGLMKIQMLGDAAVLTHAVTTRLHSNAGDETVHERETIVFAKQPDGRWLVVHEHLSPQPT